VVYGGRSCTHEYLFVNWIYLSILYRYGSSQAGLLDVTISLTSIWEADVLPHVLHKMNACNSAVPGKMKDSMACDIDEWSYTCVVRDGGYC